MNEKAQRTEGEPDQQERSLRKDEFEINALRQGASVVDAGLRAALDVIRPGISAQTLIQAARDAIHGASPDSTAEVLVEHGLPIAIDQAGSSPSRSSRLCEGELAWLAIRGMAKGFAFAGARLAPIGIPSERARLFIAHLAEAADWLIGTLTPRSQRRYVLTETRGRTLRVEGTGIGRQPAEPPTLSTGTTVRFAEGMVLRVEARLMCSEFGTASMSDMVLVGSEGPERLTSFPYLES